MDKDRLQELMSYNLTEELSIKKFRDRPTDQREKLLWQWATDKQLTYDTWCQYLDAHVQEEIDFREMDRFED